VLTGSAFDIVPGKRAIVKNSFFRLKGVPLFYTPRFYKSLERAPRKSGFLTPNIGNSSRRGVMFGGGYYWAINRSYDATYRAQWFTERGIAHNIDFRGKPGQATDFTFMLYGVNDKGFQNPDGTRRPSEGGFLTKLTGRSDLAHGFRARGEFNYLSSFEFRRAFTESFFESIYTEVHSLGHISKYWSAYAFNIAASRFETFEWPNAQTFPYAFAGDNKVSLRKLPTFEFNSRDQEINRKVLPLWVSWNANYSLLRRRERAFTTKDFVGRMDVEPRVMTALRWKDFHLIPAFSVRETNYASSFDAQGELSGRNILRSSREFSAELIMPSFARIFEHPPKIFGTRLKHVIEPRASFRYVGGVGEDFRRLIRFDETELVSDTKEAEFTLTNRLFAKLVDGNVAELLSWELTQRRYFDPEFGGALAPGQRNVLLSSATLTGYAFLDRPRNYSPIVSNLRANIAGVGFEWRTDYDPARGHITNSSFSATGRLLRDYFLTFGHNQVRSVPVTSDQVTISGLSPKANQLFTVFGYGQDQRRGFSAGALFLYDYTQQVMIYNQAQVTWNTDCCGWSVQYRRLGNRGENQFRVAFAVANIGSFGTLRRQERIF
jgi:LPS-assembly protein